MTTPRETSGPPTTENCRFCWMCRHACPVGHVTHRETYTPHAWALTIESVKRGQLEWNAETVDVMYACADCGLCQAHCATDQPLPDAIASARAGIVSAGMAPAVVSELDQQFARFASAYGTAAPVRGTLTGPVAVYVGDAAHHLTPAAAEAAVRLLQAAGLNPFPIGIGRSSGWLASSVGLQSRAVELAHAVTEEVIASGAREVLVLSAADRWAFEHVYSARLGVTWPEGVVVREVVDVLAAALESGQLRLRGPATEVPFAYHDPCHAPRLERDTAAPRALLKAALGENAARPLFWREGRAHPCGAIGGLELTHPAIAASLAASRFTDAKSAGARWLITEDPACFHYLSTRAPEGLEVRNLFELLVARA
ncbi:MAG: (Fe-S)-binding protein [Vicinamibacterales bacterium]